MNERALQVVDEYIDRDIAPRQRPSHKIAAAVLNEADSVLGAPVTRETVLPFVRRTYSLDFPVAERPQRKKPYDLAETVALYSRFFGVLPEIRRMHVQHGKDLSDYSSLRGLVRQSSSSSSVRKIILAEDELDTYLNGCRAMQTLVQDPKPGQKVAKVRMQAIRLYEGLRDWFKKLQTHHDTTGRRVYTIDDVNKELADLSPSRLPLARARRHFLTSLLCLMGIGAVDVYWGHLPNKSTIVAFADEPSTLARLGGGRYKARPNIESLKERVADREQELEALLGNGVFDGLLRSYSLGKNGSHETEFDRFLQGKLPHDNPVRVLSDALGVSEEEPLDVENVKEAMMAVFPYAPSSMNLSTVQDALVFGLLMESEGDPRAHQKSRYQADANRVLHAAQIAYCAADRAKYVDPVRVSKRVLANLESLAHISQALLEARDNVHRFEYTKEDLRLAEASTKKHMALARELRDDLVKEIKSRGEKAAIARAALPDPQQFDQLVTVYEMKIDHHDSSGFDFLLQRPTAKLKEYVKILTRGIMETTSMRKRFYGRARALIEADVFETYREQQVPTLINEAQTVVAHFSGTPSPSFWFPSWLEAYEHRVIAENRKRELVAHFRAADYEQDLEERLKHVRRDMSRDFEAFEKRRAEDKAQRSISVVAPSGPQNFDGAKTFAQELVGGLREGMQLLRDDAALAEGEYAPGRIQRKRFDARAELEAARITQEPETKKIHYLTLIDNVLDDPEEHEQAMEWLTSGQPKYMKALDRFLGDVVAEE